MNFEDEHYVRIYTRDTKTWKRWGWEAQTVFMHVMRKLDKAGVLDDIDDPVPDVALMTGLPESVVEVGLPKILKSGTLEINGTALVAPKYIEAQTAAKSDAQRQRERREKRRAEARRVTKRDGSVTEGHELSRAVTARPGSFPDAPEVPQSDPGADDRTVTKHDAPVTERDGCITDPVESVTRCHNASTSTTQGISVQSRARGEIPPTPRPDPTLDSFTGRLPDQRSDVRRLFEAWKRTFRFTGDTLRRPSDFRAKVLAEAIDDYGLEACERVLAHAPNDGMVSGRDDEKRVKHETIEYIFGNANTFARILRAADESERNGSTSAAEMVAALKRRKVAP